MKILGHRGASADFPENTLEAFEAAMAQGADGVELDVMRCGSGELVVCHDEVLDRLAGKPWVVAQTDWRTLQRADVGSALGFKPARIPTLDEVFDLLPAHALVNVELKCETVDDLGLTVEVASLLERRELLDRVLVSSFNPLCLIRLAQRAPQIPRGQLIDPDKSWWLQSQVWLPFTAKTSIHPHHSACTLERVAGWHARGLQVATWTVNDVSTAQQMRDVGVDLLITNEPANMRHGLGL